ncbi:putative RNA polymerase beta subunit [Pseudomonas phage fnug]|uniref:Putative RNA polymerase beta subunit n=1 Tax=Pseudomonas phage fnug TaxID=2719836 RepID=A0A6H2A904_9CAUD|nr:putative RNA polymerase beta subunit [Pseudomonas phage fnug]
MKLRDYFLMGINAGLDKKRAWVNVLFNIVYNPNDGGEYLYKPYFKDGKMFFYKEGDSNDEVVYIDDYVEGKQPLAFRDEFILQPGEIENYKGPGALRTTYGNVFVNHLVLCLPFGDLFPFQSGYFDIGKIEKEILNRMIDDPIDDDNPPRATDGKLYVWQYRMFADHCLALPAYASTLVTSITEKSMTSAPDRDKLRKELEEKYKDRLDDPAVIAEMGNALIKLDEDYLKDDPSYEFYDTKHSKLFGGVRKKVFGMFGGEAPFQDGTSVEYIGKSLEEGIDTDHMPVMNNSLRYGSYNRGAQTALGGESTKTIYRMVGTVRIIMEDCNTWIGIPTTVHQFNKKDFIGLSYVKNGKSILIEETNIDELVGTKIELRGPMTCKAGGDPANGVIGRGKNVCAVCMGKQMSENPNGIPAAAAGVGGRFLSIFMSKMHSAVLKTVKWSYRDRIS